MSGKSHEGSRFLRLIGPPRIELSQDAHGNMGHGAVNSTPRFRSKRTVALLGYLAAEQRPVGRDSLAALFWPDETSARGRD